MDTQDHSNLSSERLLDSLSTDEFLAVVGKRVRRQRSEKSMSRKRLAEVSGVSERYLAQLESGQGNMSIALLRKVTTAIGMSMGKLMSEQLNDYHVEVNNTRERDSNRYTHNTPSVPSHPGAVTQARF